MLSLRTAAAVPCGQGARGCCGTFMALDHAARPLVMPDLACLCQFVPHVASVLAVGLL